MEYVVILLAVLSLAAVAQATYLLAIGDDGALPIFIVVVVVWVGLYFITHQTRLRRRQRW